MSRVSQRMRDERIVIENVRKMTATSLGLVSLTDLSLELNVAIELISEPFANIVFDDNVFSFGLGLFERYYYPEPIRAFYQSEDGEKLISDRLWYLDTVNSTFVLYNCNVTLRLKSNKVHSKERTEYKENDVTVKIKRRTAIVYGKTKCRNISLFSGLIEIQHPDFDFAKLLKQYRLWGIPVVSHTDLTAMMELNSMNSNRI